MRRRFPFDPQVAIPAICMMILLSHPAWAGDALSRGVTDLVFHLTTFDEASRVLHQGQGIVVGTHGKAIVSLSILEGAFRAEARMMDGRILPVRDVRAVDEEAGMAMVRLGAGAPRPPESLEDGPVPAAGSRIMFSRMTSRGRQVCISCGVTSVKAVPGLEGIHYVQTLHPPPEPGAAVFDPDGALLGVVLMRFEDGSGAVLSSTGRMSALIEKEGRRVPLDQWSGKRLFSWQDSAYARYVRGRAALWQGYPNLTINLLEDHLAPLHAMNSNIAALMGEAYLAMDLLPEAILALKTSINFGSPPCRAYMNLAWAYMETGKYGMAEAMCRESIRTKPSMPHGYTLLAHLSNLQGDFKQAVHEARRALKRDPASPCAHFERGRGYVGLGEFKAARRSLVEATTLDPEHGEAFNFLGYTYLRMGKPLQAVVVLREAVKLEPEMDQAWENLGEAYSRAGLPDKAVISMRQAACLDPSRSMIYCRIARELMDQGMFIEAVEILEQGLTQCKESQWLVYYLGKALHKGGFPRLARNQAQSLYMENKELGDQLLRFINQESIS